MSKGLLDVAPQAISWSRAELHQTQTDLAQKAGMKQSNISEIESGKRPLSEPLREKLFEAAKVRPGIIVELLAEQIIEMGKAYGVSNIRVFGSVARGEDNQNSDVDLLVDFDPSFGGLAFASFRAETERLIGFPIDLVKDKPGNIFAEKVRPTAVAL